MRQPTESLEEIATLGTANLTTVIAIDSQSDESSDSIPSTEGQRILSNYLRTFFGELGYATEQDDFANLVVTIPATEGCREAPTVAFMVHGDTSEGTEAVERLEVVPNWSGDLIDYPKNERLNVSTETYGGTRYFVGEDVLHGPGLCPIGLDDKLGMAELMTLAQLLKSNPTIPHGAIIIVVRPDEEIGRMAAVEELANTLADRNVAFGYTVDGLDPFEVNVENFNASRARVNISAPPFELEHGSGEFEIVRFRLCGVKSHGATAKAEGHVNATILFSRALNTLHGRDDLIPVGFETDSAAETDAVVEFLVGKGESEGEEAILAALNNEIRPHTWKGACIETLGRRPADKQLLLGLTLVAAFIEKFVGSDGVDPILSEDSERHEGYSNPYAINRAGEDWVVSFRLRDFDAEKLKDREQHLLRIVEESGLDTDATDIVQQYINMGPALKEHAYLIDLAVAAAQELGQDAPVNPIRGGTGVDPFLAKGVPVANLGTGYFAPESEKELTSRQSLARHSLWLVNLVQIISKTDVPTD